MPKVKIKNGREAEQIARMIKLAKSGECHFCGDISNKHTSPIIFKNKGWFVTANDFPYKGSRHHYLIVSKKHLTTTQEIPESAKIGLFSAIDWLAKKLKTRGYSVFVRSGDMNYTGATLDHLHFHFLVGTRRPRNAKFPDNSLLVTLGHKK